MEWTDYPRIALVVLLVLTNVGLFVGMSSSDTAYGPHNAKWDGGTVLRDEMQAAGASPTIARSPDEYVEVDQPAVGFVLAPTSSYSAQDSARVRQFVSRGGTLVVAGEGRNTTNQLLSNLGVETRFNGSALRDDQNNYRNASLPRATNVSDHPLVSDVDALTLNKGTVLDVPERETFGDTSDGPTVLVRTSPVAYLDRNQNQTLDDDERIDSYPVAAVEAVGQGRVVVVSDASIFTNAMLEQEGNAAFVGALSENATTAMIDYSHRPPLPPMTYALLTIRDLPAVQVVLSLLVLGLVALWAKLPVIGLPETLESVVFPKQARSSTGFHLDERDVTAVLEERHPDWDPDRIERVSQSIIRQRRDQD
ncbi:DUF4350 domain-containing protein [Haloarculaceae archaeon H-GB1-1]|nr:DUF4350 domain-containing protein [Haloarculaceae archaeon H-GB1-1]